MAKKIGFLDLKNQFIFYASYHNHPVNVFIHLFCIWQLLWSILALFHYGPSLGSLTDFLPVQHPALQYAQVHKISILQTKIGARVLVPFLQKKHFIFYPVDFI